MRKNYCSDQRNRAIEYGGLSRQSGAAPVYSGPSRLWDVRPDVFRDSEGAVTPSTNLLTRGIDERFTRTDSTGIYNFLTGAIGRADANGVTQSQYSYDPYGATAGSGATATSYEHRCELIVR